MHMTTAELESLANKLVRNGYIELQTTMISIDDAYTFLIRDYSPLKNWKDRLLAARINDDKVAIRLLHNQRLKRQNDWLLDAALQLIEREVDVLGDFYEQV